MAARSNARKRAFQILFEADQRGVPVREVLADWIRHARSDDRQPPVGPYVTIRPREWDADRDAAKARILDFAGEHG
ncbi:hypothetical protein ACWDA9_26180, partial [Streptomyces sp. NPDC001193]